MSDSLQSLFSRCDSVLVFDTETSGLSWQRDEIIEFSAIRLTASGTEEVDEFIRCTRSLPPRIVELTGITDDLLRDILTGNASPTIKEWREIGRALDELEGKGAASE